MRADWDLETTVLLISLAIIPVLVAIILLCLKVKSKSNPDLFGVEGNIKKTKTEDAYSPASGSDKLNVSADDSNVRTPSYDRKLPDIPDDIYKNSSTKDDNSELYATVDEVPVAANGGAISSRPEISVLPGPDKNHQYAKVKKIRREEHPYAKVGECRDNEDNTDTEDYETTDKLRPRSRERLSGRSITGASNWARRQEPDILHNSSRQATPLPPEPPSFPDPHNQQHFSGDSQDSFSAKGYTSISVREPLAHIRDMRSLAGPGTAVQEGNYVTLSETSDEMYAAIEDTVYMNPGGKESAKKEEEENDPSNMYSKVDKVKKKNRQTKSYDPGNPYASVSKPSSSVNKEISKSSDNLGARPKQRSPRPPDPVDYSEYEVSHTDSRRSQTHLYNMTRSYHEDFTPRDPNYEVLASYAECPISERDPGYEIVQRRDPDYETVSSDIKDKDPQYETVPQQRNRVNSIDPGYETVPSKDPGYESVKQPDPGYETVNHGRAQGGRHRDAGYETVNPARSVSQEPRYEDVYSVVNKKQRAAPAARLPARKMSELSEEEGYETIPADKREYDPGYETIVKTDRADVVSETASTDPDYARLKDADIEYIDESADEVEDGVSDLKTGRDLIEHFSQYIYITTYRRYERRREQLINPHVRGGHSPGSEKVLRGGDRTRE